MTNTRTRALWRVALHAQLASVIGAMELQVRFYGYPRPTSRERQREIERELVLLDAPVA